MDRIGIALDSLTKVSHKVAEAMYQKASAAPAPEAPPVGGAGDAKAEEKPKQGEVIDAEYVDVDDKKVN